MREFQLSIIVCAAIGSVAFFYVLNTEKKMERERRLSNQLSAASHTSKGSSAPTSHPKLDQLTPEAISTKEIYCALRSVLILNSALRQSKDLKLPY